MKMNLKSQLTILISLSLVLLLSACSLISRPAPVQEPSNNTDSQFSKDVPVIAPTFTLQQPADLNAGKLLGSVYISDNDHYFHREDCLKLGILNTPVSRQQAQIQGYSPCPVCNP